MADDEYTLQERRVRLSEQRESRYQRAQDSRSSGSSWSAGRAATAVTQRSGAYSGKGMLTGLLLLGLLIVLIRIVADFEVSGDGSAKGNVMHPSGQYGPLPITAGLIGSFFLLSFLAIGGGTRAKIAVILGGCIVLTLGVKSLPEIEKISTTLGAIGSVVVPAPSGTEESGAIVTGTPPAGTSGSTSTGTASLTPVPASGPGSLQQPLS